MHRNEGLELTDHPVGLAGGQIGLHAVTPDLGVQLVEPYSLRSQPRKRGQLSERRSPPELQRLAELLGRLLGAPGCQRVASASCSCCELDGVQDRKSTRLNSSH